MCMSMDLNSHIKGTLYINHYNTVHYSVGNGILIYVYDVEHEL